MTHAHYDDNGASLQPDDAHNAARGIVTGLCLAGAFWAVVFGAVFMARGWW